MTAMRGRLCNLCGNNKDKLYKLRENFLDTTLYNVIKNILDGQQIAFPLTYLICNECALELLQAEIVLKRLRKAFLNDKNNKVVVSKNASRQGRTSGEGHNIDANEEDCENDDIRTNASGLKAHKRTFDFDTLLKDWTFYCTHCDYTTKKTKWYKRHLISKHQLVDPSIYQCVYCTETFKKVDAIKKHIDSEHGSKSLPTRRGHHVDRTEKSVATSGDDDANEDNTNMTNTKNRTHNFDDLLLDWTFECWQCDYKSKNAKWFKRHLITKHKIKSPPIYQCLYCTESYQRVNAIRNHIDTVHGGSPRPTRQRRKTIALDSPTPSNNTIEDEESSENTENESESDEEHVFKCTLCEHETKNPEVFRTHLMIKHQTVGAKIYKCKKCSCTFVRKGALKNHTATKHQYQIGNKRRLSQRRKSVPANFQRGPAINTELEIDDVKAESESEEDNEKVNCSDCSFEAENNTNLKRHKVMSHEFDNVIDEIVNIIETQTDSQDNGGEEDEHVIETQNDKQAENSGAAHAMEMEIDCNERSDAVENVMETENTPQELNDGDALSSAQPKKLDSVGINSHMSLLETQNDEKYIFQANQLNSTITITETENDREVSDEELLPQAEIRNLRNQVNTIISSMETKIANKEKSDEELLPQAQPKKLRSRVNSIMSTTATQNDDKVKSDEEHIFQAPQRKLRDQKQPNVSSSNVGKEPEVANNIPRTPQKQIPQQQMKSSEISRSEWIFLCSFCDYESSKRKAYKEHMINEHELKDENIYKCIYCMASYKNYKSLKSHVTSTHCIDLTSAGGCDTPNINSDSSQDHPNQPIKQSASKRKIAFESTETKESAAEHQHLSYLHNIQTPRKRKISLESVESNKESAAEHQQTPRKRKISLGSVESKETAAATETEAESAHTEVSRDQTVKKRKKVSTCVVCGKIFSSTEKLQSHIARLHGADEMYQI